MRRTLTYQDIASAHRLSRAEIDRLSAPIIERLRALPAVGSFDAAGIPARGRCVYDETIGVHPALTLAATYKRLRELGASTSVLDSLEIAEVTEGGVS